MSTEKTGKICKFEAICNAVKLKRGGGGGRGRDGIL